MASPEVAVPFLRAPAGSTFEKYTTLRPKLRNAQTSITTAATVFPEIHGWKIPAPAPAVDAATLTTADDKSALSLPVIDLGGLESGDPEARAKIVRELGSATEAWGFFQVINHGVANELVESVHEQARQFFELPLEVKKRVEIVGPNPRLFGYKGTFAGPARHKKIPVKESLADTRAPPSTVSDLAAKIWHDGNPTFSNTVQEYCATVESLGLLLLELLAESLGLQKDFYSQHFQNAAELNGTWRLHHFPAKAAPSTVWRTVPHSDPSILTLLKQDVGGLQVKKPGGTIWIDVKPLQGSFVVNVGDILEAWSNGRFPSVEHRVALSEESERFSTVNFIDARPSMRIEAPIELIDDAHPSLFVPFIAGDFRVNFEKIKKLGDIRKGKALDYVRRPLL